MGLLSSILGRIDGQSAPVEERPLTEEEAAILWVLENCPFATFLRCSGIDLTAWPWLYLAVNNEPSNLRD